MTTLLSLACAALLLHSSAADSPAPTLQSSEEDCLQFSTWAATQPDLTRGASGECFNPGSIPRQRAAAEESRLTTFVPNDDAFAQLTPEECALLETDVDVYLTTTVLGEFKAADLVDGQELQSLSGTTLIVGVTDEGTVTITAGEGGTTATVVKPDTELCLGTAHIVDAQLLPAGASGQPGDGPGDSDAGAHGYGGSD